MQLLLIEDDHDLATNIIDFLEAEGHEVNYARTLRAARELLNSDTPEVLIVDRMLPDGDGLGFVQALRNRDCDSLASATLPSGLPVLFLTARDLEADKLAGFAAGADDYVVKPFSLAELEARIRTLGRRQLRCGPTVCGPFTVDANAGRITLNGRPLALPPLQYRLLSTLIQHSPSIVETSTLMEKMWPDESPDSDKFKVHLHGLRHNLTAADEGSANNVSVLTERGVGLRLMISS